MSDPSFIYSFTEQELKNAANTYDVIENVQSLYSSSDMEKVRKQATITTKFVITCIITLFITLGVFLCFIIPSILPLGMTTVLVSFLSLVLVFLILSLGVGIIFYHLHKKNDIFLGTPNSPCLYRVLIDTETLVSYHNKQKYKMYHCYLDISTLDKKGNGKCFGYLNINEEDFIDKEIAFRINSALAILVLPFITLGAIVYNLGRLLCAPVYVLVRIITQLITRSEEKVQFEVSDIFLEMLCSLKRIVTAPFYAMAMFFSLIYSLISVRSGRIMTGIIERDWNEDVYLSFGVHLFDPQKLWKWEGGGKPKQLGKNGYYIAACMQPRYVFEFRDWNIFSGEKIFNKDPLAESDVNVASIIKLQMNEPST